MLPGMINYNHLDQLTKARQERGDLVGALSDLKAGVLSSTRTFDLCDSARVSEEQRLGMTTQIERLDQQIAALERDVA